MAQVSKDLYEGFTDPDGGEWIRIKKGTYENVCWRPSDLEMDLSEIDKMQFKVEFLEAPGFVVPPEDDPLVEKLIGKIMSDILNSMITLDDPSVD